MTSKKIHTIFLLIFSILVSTAQIVVREIYNEAGVAIGKDSMKLNTSIGDSIIARTIYKLHLKKGGDTLNNTNSLIFLQEPGLTNQELKINSNGITLTDNPLLNNQIYINQEEGYYQTVDGGYVRLIGNGVSGEYNGKTFNLFENRLNLTGTRPSRSAILSTNVLTKEETQQIIGYSTFLRLKAADLSAALNSRLFEGSGITKVYNPGLGTITFSSTAGGSSDEVNLTAAPAVSTINKLRIYGQDKSYKLSYIDQNGNKNQLENNPVFTNTIRFNAHGNNTVAGFVEGSAGFTAVGTATSRGIDFSNRFLSQKRVGYVSAATAGGIVSIRFPTAQFSTGTVVSTQKLGGFYFVCRFGISDLTTVANSRMFVGLSKSVVAPTNVEPSTLLNSIGLGHGAADANMKLYWAGSTSQTPIDLGSNFPKTNNQGYELVLYNEIGVNDKIHYIVRNINTNTEVFGTLTGTVGTQILSSASGKTGLINPLWAYRTNNTTAAAVGLDLISFSIQTAY